MMFGWLRSTALVLLSAVLAYGLSPASMVEARGESKNCQTNSKHEGSQHKKHGEMHVKSITYRKSGGFMGVNRGCDLDFSKLSHDERTKIESLFDLNEFMGLKSGTTPGAADVFYYGIEIAATGGETHSVKFDDVSLPPSLRPLITYLDSVSKDLRPH